MHKTKVPYSATAKTLQSSRMKMRNFAAALAATLLIGLEGLWRGGSPEGQR